jgi:NAD(P)-dependent dehydrogenase (short-subunit alcohol dehydrogenase family)
MLRCSVQKGCVVSADLYVDLQKVDSGSGFVVDGRSERMTRTVVVAGVGETLGTALAREFADAGDRVALLARSPDVVEPEAASIREAGGEAVAVTGDVTDPESVASAFAAIRDAFGTVDVLVHNASAPGAGDPLDADPDEFARPWRVRTFGGFLCAREVLPAMRESGGTVLFSGTTLSAEGSARLPDWSSAAHATRGFARSLARRYGPDGVHVAYVTIGGTVAPPDGHVTEERMDPGRVAAAFRRLAAQDDSAWTHELDLRPKDRPA